MSAPKLCREPSMIMCGGWPFGIQLWLHVSATPASHADVVRLTEARDGPLSMTWRERERMADESSRLNRPTVTGDER